MNLKEILDIVNDSEIMVDFENSLVLMGFADEIREFIGDKVLPEVCEIGRYEEYILVKLKGEESDSVQLDEQKSRRINMAFTPSNYDYIKTMSKLENRSMSEYVNRIIDKQRTTSIAAVDKL